MDALSLAPEEDPRGTRIGAWRVTGFRGRGVYGAVYRAVREGREEAGPVALKLAVYPRDPRFEREAKLLSLIHHPGVPRLIDAGQWRHASGFLHPYLVMEWVEGVPLYEWAARRNPTLRQVLRLLAQGADALRATHAVRGVHRDVKGDNMLVRPADDRLWLMDFGAGHYEGAERLTPSPLPPGTPAYRSPEAWDSARRFGHHPYALHVAQPVEDVFAFGVMAYRLVTDEYPPFTDSSLREGRCWQPGGGGPRAPKALNPRVAPLLDALILRMLSVKPEERGTAGELAEAMEQQAAQAGSEADIPLFDWETLTPSEWSPREAAEAELLGHRPRRRGREAVRVVVEADAAARAKAARREAEALTHTEAASASGESHEQARRWRLWIAVAAMGGLALWPQGTGSGRAEEEALAVQSLPEEGGRDAGSVSVGDTALTDSDASVKAPSNKAIAVEVPPKPSPGQLKPDAKGRCRKGLVAINGGCWFKGTVERDECAGNGVMYQGDCYAPMFPTVREPTSAPVK